MSNIFLSSWEQFIYIRTNEHTGFNVIFGYKFANLLSSFITALPNYKAEQVSESNESWIKFLCLFKSNTEYHKNWSYLSVRMISKLYYRLTSVVI